MSLNFSLRHNRLNKVVQITIINYKLQSQNKVMIARASTIHEILLTICEDLSFVLNCYFVPKCQIKSLSFLVTVTALREPISSNVIWPLALTGSDWLWRVGSGSEGTSPADVRCQEHRQGVLFLPPWLHWLDLLSHDVSETQPALQEYPQSQL